MGSSLKRRSGCMFYIRPLLCYLKVKEVILMEQIIQLISNVGFPIACCIILFMQQNKLTNTLHDISSTMSVMSARLDDIENSVRRTGANGKEEKSR